MSERELGRVEVMGRVARNEKRGHLLLAKDGDISNQF
jgi:hypothetical protein